MTTLWTDDTVTTLDLRNRGLAEIPGLERCQRLERLWLAGNRLVSLPAALASLSSLHTLSAPGNPIAAIDDGLARSVRLSFIDFSQTSLATLPASIAGWPLAQVRLMAMPSAFAWDEALARMDPTRLVSLTVGDNPTLASRLDALARFSQLKVLHLNGCDIADLPESFGALSQLETLSLHANRLEQLPNVATRLPSLRSLVVSGNPGTRRIKAALKKRGVAFVVS